MNIYDYHKFELPKLPKDFAIIVDTRERRPLFQNPPENLIIVSKALKHGDYAVLGCENDIICERKQMSDLLSYVGANRDKSRTDPNKLDTVKKLEAMKDFFFKGFIIEADDIYRIPPFVKNINKNHVKGFILKFSNNSNSSSMFFSIDTLPQ